MVLPRQQHAELKKELLLCSCNLLDSMECYCYLRNVQDLLADGKAPDERRFGEPLKGPVIPFGTIEYHPISAMDQSRLHQFGKKVLPGIFLVYALYAGKMFKGDVVDADIEELENSDASEIDARRLKCREDYNHEKKVKTNHISNRRWNSKVVWRRSGGPQIHQNTGPNRERRRAQW